MRKRLIGQVRVVIDTKHPGADCTYLRGAGYYGFQGDNVDRTLPHKLSFVDDRGHRAMFDLVLGCDRSESADIYALMGDDAEVITRVVQRGN